MSDTDSRQILSRLPDDEFFDREVELGQICALASARSGAEIAPPSSDSTEAAPQAARATSRARRLTNALLLGPPRVGKTEILRKSFDILFNKGTEVVPIYYSFRSLSLDADRVAREYLSQFLAQFIAFRRNDARFISAADEPLAAISRAAPPEDYLWVRSLVDSYARAIQSGDPFLVIRAALSSPAVAAARAQVMPVILVDNFHMLADLKGVTEIEPTGLLRAEFIRALTAPEGTGSGGGGRGRLAPVYILCGLRRLMVDLIPPDEELFDRLEMIQVGPMAEDRIERLIRTTAIRLGVDISDSTTELMSQQLNRDLFYTRAVLDAAASRGTQLKTFMEFERVYTDEVLGGRISHYLGGLLRDVAQDSRSRRAALEALALVVEANAAVPVDTVVERMHEHTADAEGLLTRLHARELLEISYGFVNPSDDPVLADYVRSKYRSEIVGAQRPVAGQELLAEKLKHSYRLMMSRYNRSVETQLVGLLSRFDFQSVPASLFDQVTFEKQYRGMSRAQARRALDEELERVRIPQIILVNKVGAGDQPGISWSLFAASGFEGGIYSDSNEVLWMVALINTKEPLDLESLSRIDQRLESAARGARDRAGHHSRIARWYVSKEGFSGVANERLTSMRAYRSTYTQLDLLQDHLERLAAGEGERRPASEFELVIPIEEDAELIAARTVEQIARAADFDQEAINQIKTALIEACINAAEHGDSPDRRIYQRFAVDDDRLTITVSNKGKAFVPVNGDDGRPAATGAKGARGRGLQIIRSLMDDVRFERTDDGSSLVMTKFLKSPKQEN